MTSPNGWDSPGPEGSTPLEDDEAEGLKLSWVATRADLNSAEQANIRDALTLPRWRRPRVEQLLDDLAVRRLHGDMFGQVWTWAGKYRTTERNIGVDPVHIMVEVRHLIDDTKYWVATPWDVDVVGYRFHHRLVQVHSFPNGNGRHARTMTDLLVRALGRPPFTWGSASLDEVSKVRSTYIRALRGADDRRFEELAAFVRS